jgi:hypothetical protein
VLNGIKVAHKRRLSLEDCDRIANYVAKPSTSSSKENDVNIDSLEKGLETIKRLLDKGLIIEDEAAKKRTELLSKIK